MKRIFSFAGVLALLGHVACGGLVEGSSSSVANEAPTPNDDPTSSPQDTPSTSPQPVKAPSSQGPSGPETGPENDLASRAKGADVIVIRYAVLGEKRPNANDECGPSAHEYSIDRKTWVATAKLCSTNTSDGHAAMFVTVERTLTTKERTFVEEELAKLEVVPMPKSCLYDGPAYEVEMIAGSTSTRYWDEDYNCQHLTSVEYVSASLGALRSDVHSILMPGG